MPVPVSPTKMSASDPKRIGGVWSFISRFNALVDWLISLSPSGATQYQTDAAALTLISGIGLTGTVEYTRTGREIILWYDVTGTVAGDIEALTLPAGMRPKQITPVAEYQYGTSGNRPGYLSLSALRFPAQTGVTRRIGSVTYRAFS